MGDGADVKAAEAALAIEKAKNQKILSEWSRTIKEREVVAQRQEGANTIGLIKAQMGKNKLSDEDVAIYKAEIQSAVTHRAMLVGMIGMMGTNVPEVSSKFTRRQNALVPEKRFCTAR